MLGGLDRERDLLEKSRFTMGSISFYVIQSGAGSCPWPPHPGNQSRRFPPSEDPTGSPLRYGGFRAASCTHHKDHIFRDAFFALGVNEWLRFFSISVTFFV